MQSPCPSGRRGRSLPRVRILALLPLMTLAAGDAVAWTPEARARMTRDAVRLMPESLRKVMQRYQKELVAGVLRPGTPEDRPEHWQHPNGDYGTAAQQVEQEARAIIAGMNSHRPLAQVVRRFGILAHRIGDVNDPLHAADRDPAVGRYYADYQKYLEQQMGRFRLVFEGYRSATLDDQGPEAYLMETAARSREYALAVRRAYREDGSRVSPQSFDVRSLAFGVGSLSYSHAVNDIMRIWLWTWEGCHGDTGRTPFPLDPPPDSSSIDEVARQEASP